ncbi:uncharacterized protein [Nicotiana sylvestris]|uniref:uncharacterized protein n=1 Tax=Nicotiana sylvestris TaxID=4096 RepID=UPI00388C5DA3
MEDLMKTFIIKIDERLDAHDAAIKELNTSFRSLERSVGHLASLISQRAPGTLPTDTERHPKETVNGETLRRVQELKDLTPIQKDLRHEKESGIQLKSGVEKKKEKNLRREELKESKNMPALPFPQKLSREKLDNQFKRFLDVLKQVHVNLPFTEVLSQMLAYPKFLKEILAKKRKIKETSVVKLLEHCNFIVVKMKENKEVPFILGRPFLVMGRAVLDIYERKLMLRVGVETVTFEMNVETGVKKEKQAASVVWKVKGVKEKAAVSEKDKCGVYPKKAEKKLYAWMCALVRARGMEPNFDSNPD